MTLILDSNNFEDTIKEGIVLVDFWAEWCWPCQVMLPILTDFSEDMKWEIVVWKVNVDNNPEIAGKYRIMSIPTLIVFKDGEIVEQMVWVKQLSELKEVCKKYL